MSRTARPDVDWQAVELDYRLGQMSVRAIAARHGLSESSIRYRANKGGWIADRRLDVKRATREAMVADAVAMAGADLDSVEDPVRVAAAANMEIIRAHRADIERLRGVVKSALAGLEAYWQAVSQGLDLESMPPDARAVFAGRGDTMGSVINSLGMTMQRIQRMEREAFGIDASAEDIGDAEIDERAILAAARDIEARRNT